MSLYLKTNVQGLLDGFYAIVNCSFHGLYRIVHGLLDGIDGIDDGTLSVRNRLLDFQLKAFDFVRQVGAGFVDLVPNLFGSLLA
jgi:hypothetical protein